MSLTRVAVVTGANRGIGLAIVKSLAAKFDGTVYLTARDHSKGNEAVNQIRNEGLSIKFHQLDIDDHASIKTLHEYLQSEYGGLDVLINNAGIKMKDDQASKARPVINTNFFGTLAISKTVLPIIKPNGRVVNIAGFISAMAMKKCSADLQKEFRSEDITEDQLIKHMEEFVTLAEQGKHVQSGYADMPYGVSKIGVAVVSKILAKQLQNMGKKDVLLNSCCPGWVHTDMGGPKAPKTPKQGAETPVYLALLPPNTYEPHGKYVSGKRVQKW
uniref:carbonyl reductase (NADPH) n=1 Tax=Phallusia mammillata TaxID=59560 RepID=A0A6F9D882_9ASCI|nr:carbonyl reductase [NADPH] 1-like [Phallusia mammillata]